MKDEKSELLFQELFVGRTFRDLVFPVSEDFVNDFLEVVQDRHPFYSRENTFCHSLFGGPLAPQSIAGIYTRLSYLQDHQMPYGGVLLAQDYEFDHFVRIGDVLTSRARVTDSYQEGDKKFVKIEVITHNQKDERISLVRFFIRWPK